MKKLSSISFILFAVFASCQSAYAQGKKTSAASEIDAIRSQVSAIDKNLGRYAKQTKNVEGVSLEGAEATFYSSSKDIRKIHASIAGETYNARADFYYQNARLIFVFYRMNRYDTQIGLPEPPKVVKTVDRRLYFADGELTKLVVGKRLVKSESKQFNESKTEITELSDKLRAGFSAQKEK